MRKGFLRFHFIAYFLLFIGATSADAQNLWSATDTFPVPKRASGSSFTLDTDGDSFPDKGYFFGGWDLSQTDYADLWQLDPTTHTWSQKASIPGVGRRGASGFVVDNIAYFIAGVHGLGVPGTFLNEVWAYNVSSNTWTQKRNFPGGHRWGMVSFVLNGKGYVALGDSGSVNAPRLNKDVWQYQASTDTWVAKHNFPGSARRMPGQIFTLDTDSDGVPDKAYMNSGETATATTAKDFWEYNGLTDTWTQKAPLPVNDRSSSSAFTIQNKGYMGFGCNGTGTTNYKDLYQYNQASNSWTKMADLTGVGRRDPYCFALGDTAYVGDGHNGNPLHDCYKYVPFLQGYNTIRGKLYVDADHSCSYDTTEQPLVNWLVKAIPGPYFASTDAYGNYELLVPNGTFTISQLTTSQQQLSTVQCPATGTYTTAVSGFGVDTSGFDFADSVRNCSFVTIDVSTNAKHRCQNNLDVVHYCNEGFAPAYNVTITVSLPPYVSLVSVDKPYTLDGDSNLIFHMDTLLQGTCTDIHIIDHIDCAHPDYIGLTACVAAKITPLNNCMPPDTMWNFANLEAVATCYSLDTTQLTITNNGVGDMTDSTSYRVYLDQVLVYIGKVKLTTGSSYSILLVSGGKTVRIEVDEPAGHPSNSSAFAWIEGCGLDIPIAVSKGYVTIFPTNPVEPEKSIACMVIDGAWDPNDKAVLPEGLTANHYIPLGTTLDYKIRFQNTGNAPANNVFLLDTLSPFLDPSTLRITGCSHAYTFHVSGAGRPILRFDFPNINLPDSGTNQLLSQGFATYTIKPYTSAPLGTAIHNTAGIYFDSNPAVITNTTTSTLSEYSERNIGHLEGNQLIAGLNEVNVQELGINLFPNPNNGQFTLAFEKPVTGQVLLSLTDITGKVIWTKTTNDIMPIIMQIDLGKASKGIYLLNVRSADVSITKKMVIQ